MGESSEDEGKRRRQRLLMKAFENLGAFGRPEEPQPAPSAPAPAVSTPPAAGAAPSASEAFLRKSVESRFTQVAQGQNHFELLGLPRTASGDEVKTAFISLVKTFHPDRLPPALSDLSAQMTAVFEAIREAHDILYDENRRKKYLVTLQQQEEIAIAAGGLEPEELYRKGEASLKRRDLRTAEQCFEAAHAKSPKAVYLAAQAWAIYLDANRKDDAPRAKRMILDALKMDSSCDRAHYQLGVIARVDGDLDKAERHFREASRHNPRHTEANQELRLIEMRKKGLSKSGFRR